MDDTKNDNPEPEKEESFADLLDKSFVAGDRLEPGEQIEAAIVKITSECIFIDLGGKSEGIIETKELQDEEGTCTVKEGDVIKAYFLSSERGEKLFSVKLGSGSGGNEHLENAFQNGIPVEGSVVKEIKGGFEVKVAGTVRAFCPYSQMGLRRVEDASVYVGQKPVFKITEYKQDGRNIVLSNRAVLEAEQRERKEALKSTLREDMVLTGTVTSVRDFGAFVDIGGVEGLIPISELGWSRVDNVSDVLHAGQEVEVKIISIDWDKERIGLSMKAVLPDPWDSVAMQFPAGSTHTGTVVRLAKFGAFVSLAPGIDGLVHISKLGGGKRIAHAGEAVTEGDTLDVTVESADPEKRRISLTVAITAQQKQDAADEDALIQQYVQKPAKSAASTESLGTLGDLLKEKLSQKK